MKYLNIIRHGESETPSGVQNDFLRSLSEKGKNDLEAIDSYLMQYNFHKHKIICSTSTRTRETLDCIKSSLNPESKIIYSHDSYLGTFKKLLKEIVVEAKNTSMLTIIGHNPGVSDLLSYLVGNYDIRDMGTSTVARLKFNNQSMDKSYESSAKIDFYVQSKNNMIIDL